MKNLKRQDLPKLIAGNKSVVYYLVCPLTDRVRWIGVTSHPLQRWTSHLYEKKGSPLKKQWIDDLKQRGLRPVMQIVSAPMSYLKALKEETRLIEAAVSEGATGLLNMKVRISDGSKFHLTPTL